MPLRAPTKSSACGLMRSSCARLTLAPPAPAAAPTSGSYLRLQVFGTEGLVTRNELFDSDRDAEALARFDELTGESAAARTAAAPARAAESTSAGCDRTP